MTDGEGEDIEEQFEYFYTLDPEGWTVYDDPREETTPEPKKNKDPSIEKDLHKNYDYE